MAASLGITQEATRIVAWFVSRWSVEATFQETRAHHGAEMQRHWSDEAIARTAPGPLALFLIITLIATRLPARRRRWAATAARYARPRTIFPDALGAMRRTLRREGASTISRGRLNWALGCGCLTEPGG